jgi:lambda family phage portal protein
LGRFSKAIDSVVTAFSPVRGLRRAEARTRLSVAEKTSNFLDENLERILRRKAELSAGGFQSADQSRSAHSWMTSRLSPDSALEADRQTMIERTDSAIKNYELAVNHVEGRVVRVAGCGMTVDPDIVEADGISAEQATELNHTLRDNWERTAERIGKHDEALWEIQHLIQRNWEERGEWFILIGDEYDPLSPTTLKIEVIDPDRVSTPPGMEADKKVRMGVEMDDSGDVIAYHVKVSQPGDTVDVRENWKRIEAKYSNGLPRIIHHFARKKARQHRGFPQMQVGQKRLKNAEEYAEAELERNWIASCFAAFVSSDLEMGDAMNSHGVVTDGSGNRIRDINPGTIHYKGLGDSVEFSNPSGAPTTFQQFMEYEGRMFAAGCNTSYELLANTWSGLSYSAGRILWNVEEGVCSVLQKGHIKTITAIYRHFVTRCVTSGLIEVSQAAYRSQPWLYWAATVIPPAKASIDPAREDRNDLTLVEAGVIPHSTVVEKKNGMPADKVYQRINRNRREMEENDINTTMPNMGRDKQNPPTQIGDANQASSDANSERQESGVAE